MPVVCFGCRKAAAFDTAFDMKVKTTWDQLPSRPKSRDTQAQEIELDCQFIRLQGGLNSSPHLAASIRLCTPSKQLYTLSALPRQDRFASSGQPVCWSF